MPGSSKESFTYGDYAKWPEGERWELIDGRPFDMTPAPTVKHQQISMILSFLLVQYFQGKPCQALHAPVDVRLPRG